MQSKTNHKGSYFVYQIPNNKYQYLPVIGLLGFAIYSFFNFSLKNLVFRFSTNTA